MNRLCPRLLLLLPPGTLCKTRLPRPCCPRPRPLVRPFSLFRPQSPAETDSKATHPLEEQSKYLRLSQDNLFHPLISSPILSIRKKAMAIKSLAVCPTSGMLEGNEFTCPNCGFPTHCSEEHYRLDQERHERESCDTLRIINKDLHDIKSGRQFPEFVLKRFVREGTKLIVERQSTENQLNFSDWDHILFTRSMEMVTSERSMRHLTNVLSYPYTIAGVLHENSPYNIDNRLTVEGLTSMMGETSHDYANPSAADKRTTSRPPRH
jgi:mitochondrial splicing suppressor protein 51